MKKYYGKTRPGIFSIFLISSTFLIVLSCYRNPAKSLKQVIRFAWFYTWTHSSHPRRTKSPKQIIWKAKGVIFEPEKQRGCYREAPVCSSRMPWNACLSFICFNNFSVDSLILCVIPSAMQLLDGHIHSSPKESYMLFFPYLIINTFNSENCKYNPETDLYYKKTKCNLITVAGSLIILTTFL